VKTKRARSVVLAATLAAGLALVVSACGGGGSTSGVAGAQKTAGRTFGTLKVVWGTTDYMDPGLSYRLESWQLFQDVYLGLLGKAYVTCGSANCTKIIPVVASKLPKVNKKGTVYKFTLRKGLKYSNGATVKPSDFLHAIIRDFKLNSPSLGFYANIVGSDACEKSPTKCSKISGIIPNNSANTLKIKLKTPESDFEYVLTLPFSALVPSSTKMKDTENPPPAADGPYYISQYKPSRSFVMLRNPHWKKNEIPGLPNGNPNKIVGKLTDDLTASAQQVVNGGAMYDENLLPTDRLSSLQSKYGKQIKLWRTPSTYYFFMNEGMAPFNKLQARQAVNYAINRQTLVNLRGGLGVPTCNFLPPTYPQYKKISASKAPQCQYNLQKAKQLVQASGTAGQTVSVYTISDVSTDKKFGEYLASQLQKIGYKPQLHELAGANYFTEVGNQATKAQIGFTDWFEDYPYPSDWFHILLDGQTITKVHNNNYGLVDFKDVNQKIAALDSLPPSKALAPSTNAKWAALDQELQAKYAATAPFLNGVLTSFFSTKMDTSCDVFDDWGDDMAQFCMK
jgi:peptide/nickel transport system substrate-binding protein